MSNKTIRLNEEKFLGLVREMTRSYLNEVFKESEPDEYIYDYDYDEPEGAMDDFNKWGFEEDLKKRYPEMEFECEVSDRGGEVTVYDLNTGKYYTSKGEVHYDYVPAGYPDQRNRDEEACEKVPFYDFTKAFNEIMQKIDNDKPDGVEPSMTESVDVDGLKNAIHEAVIKVLNN